MLGQGLAQGQADWPSAELVLPVSDRPEALGRIRWRTAKVPGRSRPQCGQVGAQKGVGGPFGGHLAGHGWLAASAASLGPVSYTPLTLPTHLPLCVPEVPV